MKILAIRGKNLASLAGEFVVDFQQEPLASCCLFAISGPTGAGKSTLLDALCLALYDDTPRLTKAGSKGVSLPDVGDKTTAPQDTRNLLRRGSSEAYAQVDFIGNDQQAWRATWSVRRAGGKSNGSLQKIAMSLQSLPGLDMIGGSKISEVKADIVQRIGLNFEQFTRAVLLAQNEFSAFLKADDNERGALLEQLTGSRIYSQISKRAFQREKAENITLQQYQAQLAGSPSQNPEQRAALEQQLRSALENIALQEQQKQALEQALEWQKQQEKLLQSEQQAQASLQHSREQAQDDSHRRDYLAQVESVQSARPLLAECQRIQADISQQQQQIGRHEYALQQTEKNHAAADMALNDARHAWQIAEQTQQQAAPTLDLAKALDAQLDTARPAHQQLGSQTREMQAAYQAAQQKHAAKQSALQQAQQRQQTGSAWLAEHRHWETLATSWPRWDTLFNQAGDIAKEQTKNQQQRKIALEQIGQLQESNAAAKAQLQTATSLLDEAQQQRQAAVSRLEQINIPALLANKQAAETRREQLAQASGLWHSLEQHLKLNKEQQQQSLALQTQLDDAERQLQALATEKAAIHARLAQAERAEKLAQAACSKNVEDLRATLEAEQACPVCGACNHPYTDSKDNNQDNNQDNSNHRLHTLLHSLQAEVAHCRAQQQAHWQQSATNSTIADGSRSQLQVLQQQIHTSGNAILTARAAWEQHPIAAEMLANNIADGNASLPWLEQQSQSIKTHLLDLAQQEHTWREASHAKDQAQNRFELAFKQQAEQQQTANHVANQLTQAFIANDNATAKCLDAAKRLALTLAALQGAFDPPGTAQDLDEPGSWQANWRTDPAQFHQLCQLQAQQWQTAHEQQHQSQMQIDTLGLELRNMQETLGRLLAETQQMETRHNASQADLNAKQSTRQSLFEGQTVQQVETALAKALSQAKHALDTQTLAHQQHQLQLQSNKQALAQARQQYDAHHQALEKAALALEHWILQANSEQATEDDLFARSALNMAQLHKLLAHDEDWRQNELAHRQQQEQAVRNAATVLHERQNQIKNHQAQAPHWPTLMQHINEANDGAATTPMQQLQHALQSLAAERQAAQTRLSEYQLTLAQDDERRRQAAATLAKIEQQTAVHRVWAQLNELIGSADGKKFRNAAQQFTLEVLLGYANHHLAQLSRRYRLERIKDTLALMVLDQDMGDELRSVHSLSGGESFLVSLALALGLASLSSNRVRVESLFIDEGFGSLDADTLRVAMDALDGLQSLGRKVGVISHVQEMTERIAVKVLVQRAPGGKSSIVVNK